MTSNMTGDTIPQRFMANVSARGDLVALRSAQAGYSELTYRQYAIQVAQCAAGLAALGFGPGQRLVLMLRNRPEFHILDMAAYFLGGTSVSIYNSSAPEQIQYLVEHCEATIAIADDLEFLARFQAVVSELPGLKHLGVLTEEAPSGVLSWKSLMSRPPLDLERAAQTAKPDDIATLIYTSGTTGAPKAVMLKHSAIVRMCDSSLKVLQEHPALQKGLAGVRVVSYLPMAHIAERNMSHYFAAFFGQEVTCCPDPAQFPTYLRQVRPELVFGVPRVWEKIHAGLQAVVSADVEGAKQLNAAVERMIGLAEKMHTGIATAEDRASHMALDESVFKRLRELCGLDRVLVALTAAAPMPRDLQLWFRAIGVALSDIYGLSECCGPMTWTAWKQKPGTVGRAIPGLEVKLAEDGEILCRGASVFSGYLKAPEQTSATLDADGWLHSGDIGKLDEDGFFSVVDRKKELLITSGGDNISPANLEAALKGIPLVGQACAIGDKRPFVAALLVLDPEIARARAKQLGLADLSLEALARHPTIAAEIEAGLEHAMAGFGRVERVKRFVVLHDDWLPDSTELTPTSKLKRRSIHAKYAEEIETLYATGSAQPTAGA